MNRAGNKALIVLGIAVVGTLLYVGLLLLPDKEIDRTASGIEEISEVDSLQRVMAEGTLDESIQYIKVLEENPDDPVPVRIETLRNKLDLAQRIVDLSNSDSSRAIGNRKIFEAQFELQRIYLLNDLGSSSFTEQFRKTSFEFLNSKDPEASRLAQLAMVYLHGVVDEPDADDGATDGISVDQAIRKLAREFPNDEMVVLKLLKFAREFTELGKRELSDKVLQAVSSHFEGSQNRKIGEAVVDVNNLIQRRKFKLTSDRRGVQKLRKQVLQKNSEKIEQLVDSIQSYPELDTQYIELVNCLLLITQAGFPDVAIKRARKVAPLFEFEGIPATKKLRFVQLTQIIEQKGSELKFVETVNEQIDSRPTLLLLVSPSSDVKILEKLRQIGEMTRLMIADSELDVLVVILGDATGQQLSGVLQRKLDEFPGIKTVSTTESESKAFLDEFPIGWLPTWVVLDSQKQLAHVSPPIPILEQLLLEMIAAESKQ